MNKKRIIIMLLFIIVLGGIPGRWLVIKSIQKYEHNRRQELREKREREAEEFALVVADSYCSGESQRILDIIYDTDENYPASLNLLPDGLELEYVDRSLIDFSVSNYTVNQNLPAFATYVIKYRVIGDIPEDLGSNIVPDNIIKDETDGENAFLFQTIGICTDKNDRWVLMIAVYGQYTF